MFKHLYISFFLSISILLILPTLLIGQSNNMRFRRISVEDGLSNNNVLSILQDHQGLMWIGTGYGLNSYNGYEFKYYNNKREDSLSLSDDYISVIYEDSHYRLWIGTGNGINEYNGIKDYFSRHLTDINNDLSSKYIRVFFEDSQGRLWAGTSKGLYIFNEKEHKYKPYLAEENIPIRINTIYEDFNDQLLIGTLNGIWNIENQKLSRFNLADEHFNKILRSSEIRSIEGDNSGNLWVATEGEGLFRIDKHLNAKQYTVQNTNGKLSSDLIRVVKTTEKGDLWIGTREGLTIYDPVHDIFHSYSHNKYDPFSLSHNSIRDIYQDHSGGIWVATSGGGLNYYHPNNNLFNLINQELGTENTLNYNHITAVEGAEGENIWIGTSGRGINFYNIKKNTFKFFKKDKNENSLINDDIKSISLDSSGNLWIGTYGGISYLNVKSETFKNYALDKLDEDNPLLNQVHTTLIDHNGNLWAGTNGAGLVLFEIKKNKFTRFISDESNSKFLITNHIDVLFEDSHHNIWVGTRLGLDVLNTTTMEFNHTSLKDIKTQSIHEDRYGNMWIGTKGQGLYLYFPNGKSLNFNRESGLPGNVIHAILEDSKNNLWMSTNRGLSKMIISRNQKGGFEKAEFTNFNKSDGVQGNQFFPGSAYKSPAGKMFFGGINGLNFFFPENIPSHNNYSPVLLTDLKIKNQVVKPGKEGSPLIKQINYSDEITLNYNEAEFTVEFAALNYLNPYKSIYAYKLEGFDNDWNYIGQRRNVTFTYPSDGSYVFKVKSSTSPNYWPKEYAAIKINVLPPPWKSNWAYAFYLVCLLLFLYVYHRITSNFSKLKRDKELSQGKFKFFTNISHEIKTPLTLILAPLENLIMSHEGDVKTYNQLIMMKRNGNRLIHLINQLLDYRKFESGAMKLQAAKGNIVKFTREIFISFKALSEKNNINFEFTAPDSIEVWYDRDKLEKIIFNILSNAFKFTNEGGKINIKLSSHHQTNSEKYKNGYCDITIEDTGSGIPEKKLKQIFKRFMSEELCPTEYAGSGIGLNLAKRLINIHKGEILVDSKISANGKSGYSQFKIRLPLGKDYLKNEQIVLDFKDSEEISQYAKVNHEIIEHNEIQESETKKGSKNQILLIVEDNDELRSFISSFFKEDFKVYEAKNGKEGLQKAFQLVPDIIISDIMMPIMDGIQFCKKLKNDYRTSHIPIILLTARTPLIFRIEGIETGADDYVTKPFSTLYLKKRVQNLLHNREKLMEKFRKELLLQPKKITIKSPDDSFLENLLQHIEKNMDNPNLSVEDLGKEIGMSRSNLYRKIKALTGLSIVKFIRDIRVKRAAQLLKEKKLNVNQIAYMTGFQDLDYFRKCFKDEFKVTPTQYINPDLKK